MRLLFADLRVWWAQMMVECAMSACRASGGAQSPYIDALAAAMTERDEAVKEADRLRR